jgi:hypothetical protein
MNPVKFPDANLMLNKPASMSDEECKSLPVYREYGVFVSSWKPSIKDIIRMIFGGRIWLTVVGDRHPPVAVDAKCPIVR